MLASGASGVDFDHERPGQDAMTVTASPRLDRTVTLRDGRSVGYAEWGAAAGTPVVMLPGQFFSRLICPDGESTDAANVRLITMDISGYGRSDPRPDPTLLGWAADFDEFAGALDLPPCPLIGWSAGGEYALAAALHVPARVTRVGICATPAAPDRLAGGFDSYSPEALRIVGLIRTDVEAARKAATEYCQWFADDWRSWAPDVKGDADDPDLRLLARPDVWQATNAAVEEGARQGSAGYVGEWLAASATWGFELGDIKHHVDYWWGDRDQFVGPASGEYLTATIPDAHLTVFAGDGHFAPVNHWGEVLSSVI